MSQPTELFVILFYLRNEGSKVTGAYSRHFHHRCLFLTQGEKWVTGAYSRHFHRCLLPDAGSIHIAVSIPKLISLKMSATYTQQK